MTRTPTRNSYSGTGMYSFILLAIAGIFIVVLNQAARAVHAEYNDIDAIMAIAAEPVAEGRIGNETLHIPNWGYFSNGHIWSLVSKHRSLPDSFTPQLADAPIAHTAGDIKVASTLVPYLVALTKAAAEDGVDLMLSSAYRSAGEQKDVYDSYLRQYGQSYVNSYVALPGTSEHQTGLAVDLATASNECKRSANNCSLDYASIVWLSQNAEKFGFIQRYPTGKQSITGISSEAWHYRFVGIQLARVLSDNNMTLDEFVQQVAPGYSKNLE